LVRLRNENRKKNPNYAGTLKIVSNSIYGSIGYENSPMYSPLCSSSVTAIGRWCLALACTTFTENGLDVVYGDTDSCFVRATETTRDTFRGDVMEHAKASLKKLHSILGSTPLKGMSMAIEDHHRSVLLIDKKMYCTLSMDGKIRFKGMSVVRRDSLGICKRTCTVVCKYILESTDIERCKRQISDYICKVIYDSVNNMLSYSDVSKVAKRDQKRCYVYKDKNNKEQYEPVDTSKNVVENYSVVYVLSSLNSSISKILGPCGLGTLYEIVERYSEL
jgi:DNA polymerase elongation subunit (family B)